MTIIYINIYNNYYHTYLYKTITLIIAFPNISITHIVPIVYNVLSAVATPPKIISGAILYNAEDGRVGGLFLREDFTSLSSSSSSSSS